MKLISYFSPLMPQRFVYMLQLVEYDPRKFMRWVKTSPNLFGVIRRGQLVYTKKARALLLVAYGAMFFVLSLASIALMQAQWLLAIGAVVLMPVWVATVLSGMVTIGQKMLNIVRRPLLKQAQQQLVNHPATKIAVLGSYGKTSMKEMLVTVLSESKRVKATPGNMNVPISHARWITRQVKGDEEVLIFEYGEGEPGDITKFARLTSPQRGVITGIAPNHLDRYPSLEALADDLLSIRQFVPDEQLLLNGDAKQLHQRASDIPVFDEGGISDWKVTDIKISHDGTSFTMTHGGELLKLKTQLLGKHHIGPLAAVVSLAYELGLSAEQIKAGIAKTQPFEHRMQARSLHGAWIIDDTYNGNLEGVRVGLRLMNDLQAKQRVYVTPGLVDQGIETERVHGEIGRLIAKTNPDKVVLMKNSVTDSIKRGLEDGNYSGEVIVEDDPLSFYTNIEHTVAAGDLVLMQNDWPDNYQ